MQQTSQSLRLRFFVFVFSLKKACSSGDRWEHVLLQREKVPNLVCFEVVLELAKFSIFTLCFSFYVYNMLLHRCLRLGLQPLAYLWHRDQASLLSEMISSDLHAILIKVAAFGEFVSHFLCLRQHVSSLMLCPLNFSSFCTLSESAMLVK